jgi:hypothetical protein
MNETVWAIAEGLSAGCTSALTGAAGRTIIVVDSTTTRMASDSRAHIRA